MADSWLKRNLCWILVGFALLLLLTGYGLQTLQTVEFLRLNPVPGMTEAGIYYLPQETPPRGILVLASGYNNTSGNMIRDMQWQEFAGKQNLALVEIAFASKEADLQNGKGYYYVSRGSGDLLLQAVDGLWQGKLPIFLFGFSGGAQFSSRLMMFRPDRIAGWAAYSAGWWDKPKPMRDLPPGMVICGNLDERFAASSEFFLSGRQCNYPWAWVGVAENVHCVDERIPPLVREYFTAILAAEPGKSVLINTSDNQITVGNSENTSSLPNAALAEEWQKLRSVPPEQ